MENKLTHKMTDVENYFPPHFIGSEYFIVENPWIGFKSICTISNIFSHFITNYGSRGEGGYLLSLLNQEVEVAVEKQRRTYSGNIFLLIGPT